MCTVEQTPASVYLTRLTEIEESSTGGGNAQEIDIEDSVSQTKDIRKGTLIPSKKDTFQQVRKTFRNVPRHETPKPTSRLASPFNQTIDINNLNRRTHSYDGMYYAYAEIVYSDKQEQSGVPAATISEWIPEKPSEDSFRTDKGSKKRSRQIVSNPQERIHTKKKDLDKSTHNSRQKAKASKGKASDIWNYGQVKLDYPSEAELEVKRLYF